MFLRLIHVLAWISTLFSLSPSFFFFFFLATLVAYGSSQARDPFPAEVVTYAAAAAMPDP